MTTNMKFEAVARNGLKFGCCHGFSDVVEDNVSQIALRSSMESCEVKRREDCLEDKVQIKMQLKMI